MSDDEDAIDLYLPNDFIALSMGRLAAERIGPERLHEFRKSRAGTRERSGDSRYLRMWEEILDKGEYAVAEALTETSQRGQILRSVISFRAFVSKAERDDIVRTHPTSERPRVS